VTFKKRRIGLIKKAMQLSKLTNCNIRMTIYNPEDRSLVEYFSQEEFKERSFDVPSSEVS
jgi:hypothetical protein